MRRITYKNFLIGISIIGILLFVQDLHLQSRHNAKTYYILHSGWGQTLGNTHYQYKTTIEREYSEMLRKVQMNVLKNRSRLDEAGIKFFSDFQQAVELGRSPPFWQRELFNRTASNQGAKKSFYLTHLLMVRLYHTDLAKWTLRELKQWIHYMFLIGIEHIYICDHWHPGDDNMELQLQQYINLSLLTYTRTYISTPIEAQVECYRNWVSKEGWRSVWMISVDMDEYPYHLEDKEENFLIRYLTRMSQGGSNVVEIIMDNFLMLGQGDRSKNITVDRIRRLTPQPVNDLAKPIFKPQFVTPRIHSGTLRNGSTFRPSDSQLRMLHYWGARLQNWGPDTDSVLNMTIPYNDMAEAWVNKIRNSLLCFGEWDAFATDSGP